MAEVKLIRTGKSEMVWAKKIAQFIQPEAKSGLMLPWSEEELRKGIEKGDAILAFRDNTVIGHIGLVIWTRYVETSSLIISLNERGKGIGRLLLSAGTDLGQEKYPEKEVILLPNRISFQIGLRLGFEERSKDSFDREIWESCRTCLDLPKFPDCHCRPMILKKKEK